MTCPKCGGDKCQIINEVSTTGKDYSAGKGCCGFLLFGWVGLLCGLCGKGKQTINKAFWVCSDCGNKFRV